MRVRVLMLMLVLVAAFALRCSFSSSFSSLLLLLLLHLLLHLHLSHHHLLMLSLELLDKLGNGHASLLGINGKLSLDRLNLLGRGHLARRRHGHLPWARLRRTLIHGGRVLSVVSCDDFDVSVERSWQLWCSGRVLGQQFLACLGG